MLMIRLQRLGKKKQPHYRFIVSEKHRDTQFGSLEILGFFNPTQQPKGLEIKKDRVEYWLSKGAQMSDTVHNIFVKEGIVTAKAKRKSVTISKRRQEKINATKVAAEAKVAEAKAAEETKKKQEEEAKKVAEEQAKAAAEAEKAAQAVTPEAPVESENAEEEKKEE